MLLQKRLIFAALLFCSCALTGCFEIIEQLSLNVDGSGTFQITANFSQSKTKLNSIRKMKTINGHTVPSEYEVNNKIKEVEKLLNSTVGISAVKSTTDYTNYITTISCNFNKISSLNTALKKVSGINNNKENAAIAQTFKYDGAAKTFSQTNKLPLKAYYADVSSADKEIFTGATFTSITKFNTTINTNANTSATISPSKKAVMIKHKVLDIISGKKSIDNTIIIN